MTLKHASLIHFRRAPSSSHARGLGKLLWLAVQKLAFPSASSAEDLLRTRARRDAKCGPGKTCPDERWKGVTADTIAGSGRAGRASGGRTLERARSFCKIALSGAELRTRQRSKSTSFRTGSAVARDSRATSAARAGRTRARTRTRTTRNSGLPVELELDLAHMRF